MTMFMWSTPPANAGLGLEAMMGSYLAAVRGWLAPAPAAAARPRTPNVTIGPTVFHPPGAVRLATAEEEEAAAALR